MTVCFLVRHAAHDLLGRVLVGRQDALALSEAGHAQVGALVRRLAPLRITRIQSSPRDRAVQTAVPIAARSGLAVEVCDALDEVDFGSWAGQRFSDLAPDPNWRRWNDERAQGVAPGGERMGDVQARIMAHLLEMHVQRPRARIVMVSHAEVIRAVVLHVLAMSLNDWRAVDVAPGSITAVRILPHGCDLIGFEEAAAA
jgi:broad specificity phosphatase PhoE